MYDLAIIGGGPAGYVAAENAGAKGLKVVLFEKRELGGVCLNEGCIPTKTLLYSAKMYDHATGGKKYGITANEVLPGSIHTDFNDDVLSDAQYYARCVEGIPMKRIGKPEDIAGAVVMLASEEASYISGAEIVVDGAKTVF
jgi:dihydrolipoamide dehydrogenase